MKGGKALFLYYFCAETAALYPRGGLGLLINEGPIPSDDSEPGWDFKAV